MNCEVFFGNKFLRFPLKYQHYQFCCLAPWSQGKLGKFIKNSLQILLYNSIHTRSIADRPVQI